MNSAMKETGCESGGDITQQPALQVKRLGSSPHAILGFNPSFVTAGKCDIAVCVGIISSANKVNQQRDSDEFLETDLEPEETNNKQ